MGIKTRFAPSPTGYLHLGNVWVAFLNWLWTRQNKGRIILRIEDIDQSRCRADYISAIKEDLSWLGLDWDEEPGHVYAYGEPIQSKRFSIYEGIKKRWEAEDSIYPCFCSRARIHNISSAPHLGENKPVYDGHCRNLSWSERGQTDKEPSWRIRMKKQEISFCDMFCGKQIKTLEEGKDDFIIFRADGAVSYQLAASADDGIMQVTHVFRGNDLLPSTFYQIYLLRKLGYQIPLYGHLPLLVDKYGIRLSKRQGGITIRELRANGKSPGEIIGRMLYWSGAVKTPLSVNARAALINIPFNTCTRLGSAYIVAE
ncbi:tRNA glutamyl-Q(34) synthetase GluQRS [Dialister invisus]|uniref:tRNA glutamyl-Q(34) synthetase GluQRS n=1 Tax=Dialister invisus TaxID=218538 RepID=UPI0026DBC4F1|nr:tRNA glutamyl-Q(34) synthetase GluQRS [Dialister invisus]